MVSQRKALFGSIRMALEWENFLRFLIAMSFSLAVLNLLPIYQFDGEKILECVLKYINNDNNDNNNNNNNNGDLHQGNFFPLMTSMFSMAKWMKWSTLFLLIMNILLSVINYLV